MTPARIAAVPSRPFLVMASPPRVMNTASSGRDQRLPGRRPDRAEADRILGRKYSRRNWPPVEWSPVHVCEDSPADVVVPQAAPKHDCAGLVLSWIDDMGLWQPRVSDMIEYFCVSTKLMRRADMDSALVELELLNVLQVIKVRPGVRGPRPRVAQLYLWYYDALRAGCQPSISEVRARADGGGSA